MTAKKNQMIQIFRNSTQIGKKHQKQSQVRYSFSKHIIQVHHTEVNNIHYQTSDSEIFLAVFSYSPTQTNGIHR